MTVVNLALLETVLGGYEPVASGLVEVTYWAGDAPYRGLAGAEVRFATTIKVRSGGEPVTMDLEPTRGLCCVRWEVQNLRTGAKVTRYTTIPDVPEIPFGKLEEVDKDTFEPSAEAQAAWEATLAEVQAAASVAVGAAESAGASAGAAGLSAAAADVSAGEAAGSASVAAEHGAAASDAAARAEATAATIPVVVRDEVTVQVAPLVDAAAGSASDAAGMATSAAESATQAGASSLAAGAARDEAVDAAERAEAVPAQVDTAMATLAADPDSDFSNQLTHAVGEKVQPVANDAVASAVTAQDIPGKVATATSAAVTDADIPALVGAQVVDQVAPKVVEAQEARTGAETARTGAEAARDLALAGQFAGAALGTANLNSIIAPGVYRQANSAPATVENNYPKVGARGVLIVTQNEGGAPIQRYVIRAGGAATTPDLSTRGEYIRAAYGGTWTPWRFIPTQRIDTTAGLAVYTWDDVNNRELLIYGDTGKRRVEHLFENGWTASLATVRRIGNVVEFAAYGLRGQEATGNGLFVLPTGFRDNATNAADLIVLREPLVTVNYTTGRISSTARGGSYAFRISLLTVDPWPTILPGSLG